MTDGFTLAFGHDWLALFCEACAASGDEPKVTEVVTDTADLAPLVEAARAHVLAEHSEGADREEDIPPEVSRVANSIGFALAERGVEVSADDAVAAARRALDQRSEFLAAEPARGRETSRALIEARSVLSRAETALWTFGRGDTELDWSKPRSERVYRDPDHDDMVEALREVVRLLARWRRTGRPRKGDA